MTDAQFGMLVSAIVTGCTAVGIALRWCVNRIVKSWDDNTKATMDGFEKQLEYAREMAVFSTKLDAVSSWVVEAAQLLERWSPQPAPVKRLPTPVPDELDDEDEPPPRRRGGSPIRGVPIIHDPPRSPIAHEPPQRGGGYGPTRPKKPQAPEE